MTERDQLEQLWRTAARQLHHSPGFDQESRDYASGESAERASLSSLRMLCRWCTTSPNPTLRHMALAVRRDE